MESVMSMKFRRKGKKGDGCTRFPHSLKCASSAQFLVSISSSGINQKIGQLVGSEERPILQQNATYNLDKLSTEKCKPLQTLALSGQIRFMDKLLADGLDIDKEGWTPLHVAVQTGKRDVKILLVNGADENRRNKDGMTPMDLCLCYGEEFKSYDLAKLVKIQLSGMADGGMLYLVNAAAATTNYGYFYVSERQTEGGAECVAS
ncbi:aberrant large forked product, putative [Ricinus communis]|uniref:Aberrant large forked product, putative n=1 Tax=Ricinus communis TaxID=3988 RepID=B9S1R6_RICCO|nr:aberrant large forked product, putative [Ricinus communis]